MYVKIRKIGAKLGENDLIINISKKAKIQELRETIEKELKIKPEQQMLLYKGKQLVDDHTVMDYDIRLNDVIQLMIKFLPEEINAEASNSQENVTTKTSQVDIDTISQYYKIGDLVDVRLSDTGGWYEAKLLRIFKKRQLSEDNGTRENEIYFRLKSEEHVHVVGFETDAKFDEIRPQSYHKFGVDYLKPDMVVLVNYNLENPKARGLWYDFKVTEVVKNINKVKGTVFLGDQKASVENCTIHFVDEIFKIKTPSLLSERSADDFPSNTFKRTYPIHCEKCKDVRTKKCRECGCKICAGKDDIDKIILCDECDYGYHINCLIPPLDSVPEDEEWY